MKEKNNILQMQQLLTMQQIKERFQVKDNRTIQKFIREGLRFIKIGKEYRFDIKDIEVFEEQLKTQAQEKVMDIKPVKQKRRYRTVNIDYEKRKINLEELRVI